jgi:hypothetical protein
MSDVGNYLANYTLDYWRTSKSWYAEPSSTPPNLDGTNVTPCAQGDKVRSLVAFGSAAVNRVMTSTGGANFISGSGAASGNAGPFPYLAWYDAVTGGNFLGRTTLTSALAWVAGQTVTIATGDLTVTQDS